MTGSDAGDGVPSGALPPEEERQVPDPTEALGAGESGRIGIFPSWRWLYGTVIVYAAVVVLLLYLFTVTLDFGAR